MQINGTMFREMTDLAFNQNNTLSLISVVYLSVLKLMPGSVLLNVLILNFLKWNMFPNSTLHLSVAKQVVRWTLRQPPKDKPIQASRRGTSQKILLSLQIKGWFPSFSAKKSFRRQWLIATPSAWWLPRPVCTVIACAPVQALVRGRGYLWFQMQHRRQCCCYEPKDWNFWLHEHFRPGAGSLTSGWKSSSQPCPWHNEQTVKTKPKFYLRVLENIPYVSCLLSWSSIKCHAPKWR